MIEVVPREYEPQHSGGSSFDIYLVERGRPTFDLVRMEYANAARALLLVCAVNSAPWIAGRILGARGSAPLDCGLRLRDGERLFGTHKTWRGLAAGVLVGAFAGWAMGLGTVVGGLAGVAGLSGDAVSSAIKRRFRLRPGSEILGLDQLPEALLAVAVLAHPLGLGGLEVAIVALAFTGLDFLATPLRH